MRYDEIIPQLLDRFPELAEPYKALCGEWSLDEPPGVYNVMDIAWQPLVESELWSSANHEFLRRAFAFVEELCESADREARFVAAEISWGQLGATPLLDKARPYFGECTRELVAKCEAEWLETRQKRRSSWWRRLTLIRPPFVKRRTPLARPV
jgi:hypothetical protein